MFREESFGKTNAKDVVLFRNGSVHEFHYFKASITLAGTSEYSVVEKKKNLYEQNFDGEANNNKKIAILVLNSSIFCFLSW